MDYYICTTCGTQFAQSETPPQACPICSDQRQYIGYEGQTWTTLAAMQAGNFHTVFKDYEPHLTGIGTEPPFAIGQRALLLQTDQGNVLWDCMSFLDSDTVAAIQRRGGLKAIAISHPHFYTTMVEWAEQFDAPIYLHEANRRWVMRPSEHITFWPGEALSLLDEVTLVRLGGHFSGSAVLHWSGGADGKGLLLTGDTIQVVADRNWVSFMYSFPNLIPLPVAAIRRICDGIAPYSFERLYGMRFESVVATDAKNIVLRSAERYMRALEERLT
jgi:hypothetical protein